MTFVVLQHSPDKKFVYAAVMEKCSLEPPVKRATSKSPIPTSRTAIHRKETDEVCVCVCVCEGVCVLILNVPTSGMRVSISCKNSQTNINP